jgi:glycosyltransferase involved in cell wall biosynthesis
MERMVYREARFAFPITHAVAEVVRAKGFYGENAVSPLPLDLDVYHPLVSADHRSVMPPAEGVVTLGYVGRLIEAKGLRTLALALGRIAPLAWRLIVIGSGPYQREFDRLLEALGVRSRVMHLGFIPHQETPRYLSNLDVLVLPSETQPNWKEQFGRVIPEALACGTAVVGSDSGEIPRLIRESGGGLVFPEGDVAGLAAALEQMIASPALRQELARRGREWVTTYLAVPRIASHMAEVIARAVAERNDNARKN